MSNQTITVDQLEDAISQILTEYGNEAQEAINTASEKIAKGAVEAVQAAAPVGRRKGKYKKSIKQKQTKKTPLEVEQVVYAEAPEYRLTHLLEHGHATSNGTGRVAARPHWQKGQDYIDQKFEQEVRKELENNG